MKIWQGTITVREIPGADLTLEEKERLRGSLDELDLKQLVEDHLWDKRIDLFTDVEVEVT